MDTESFWGRSYPAFPRLLEDATPSIAGDWYDITTVEDVPSKKRFVDGTSNKIVIISTHQNEEGAGRLRSDGFYETVLKR